MFGKRPTPRRIFSRHKQKARIPWVWIVLAAVLFLLFYLVPTYDQPVVSVDQITPFLANYTPPPSPSPTPRPTPEHGGRIVFTCTRGDFNQLCIINADGTEMQQLSADAGANDYYPVFNPDGKALMFASNRNGTFDIYLMVFGQRELFQITSNVGNILSPDFSPDGKQIVFTNQVGETPAAIWMVNTDGSDPHLFYAGSGNIVAVAWSPDGRTIAYAMETELAGQYQVYLMDVNGTNQRQLTAGMQGVGG